MHLSAFKYSDEKEEESVKPEAVLEFLESGFCGMANSEAWTAWANHCHSRWNNLLSNDKTSSIQIIGARQASQALPASTIM